jgi:class 3 adenylate cyclase
MNVFLPPDVELHRLLPHLMRATAAWLARSNAAARDRLRLRMAVAFGPVGIAALGYSGNTIVECSRLVDSQVLRAALAEHPEADIAVLVSDRLWSYVRDEDHPALAGITVREVQVQARNYERPAYLWLRLTGSA